MSTLTVTTTTWSPKLAASSFMRRVCVSHTLVSMLGTTLTRRILPAVSASKLEVARKPVVSVTSGDSQTIVNVVLPSSKAADLAARAATGKIAVVLDSRVR